MNECTHLEKGINNRSLSFHCAGSVVLLDAVTADDSDDGDTFVKSPIEIPEVFLRRVGYSSVHVTQMGAEDAKFGHLHTNANAVYAKKWAYKIQRHVTIDEDGEKIARSWLINARM